MKVQGLRTVLGKFHQGKNQNPRKQDSDQSGDKKSPQSEEESQALFEAALDSEVQWAIEQFGSDPKMKASGIRAELAGKGEALKVSLKDLQGNLLRELSGTEFIELRTHGRLLDRKL